MKEFKFVIEDNLITPEVNDFCEVASNCVDLYSKKNHDYGNSFDKGMEAIGMAYGVGRIYDKTSRLANLTKPNPNGVDLSQAIKDESIDDTILDLACYAMMLYKYRKAKRLEKTNEVVLN